jgi:hypothetical protein
LDASPSPTDSPASTERCRSVGLFGTKELAKLQTTAVNSALRGRQSNTDRVRDLDVRETVDVPEDDSLSILVGKLSESSDDAPTEISTHARLRKVPDTLFACDVLGMRNIGFRESLATRP